MAPTNEATRLRVRVVLIRLLFLEGSCQRAVMDRQVAGVVSPLSVL
jgi:hypothetical protein